jgi:hypothetical protein
MAVLVLLIRKRLGTAGSAELRAFMTAHRADGDRFLQITEAHEAGGVTYDGSLLEGWLGDETLQSLRASLARRAASNLMLFREMGDFAALMQSHGFRVIFHKGLQLGELLFGDLTTRPTRDLDVLIRREDFLPIRAKLLEVGFEEVYHFPLRHAEYYMGINREAVFRRRTPEGLMFHVELQWAPVLPLNDVPYNNDYFFRHAGKASLAGKTLDTLDPQGHLLIILLHHGVTDLWRSLRHVSDLAFFLQVAGDRIDWADADRIATEWKFKKNASTGMALCRDLFGVPLPSEWKMQYDEKALVNTRHSLLSHPMLHKRMSDPAFLRRQFLLADDLRSRLDLSMAHLRKFVSPGLFELENLSLPGYMFPLYYFTKPFRFIFRMVRHEK